ncbi:MAG: DUF1538 domain-containing protein [Clostridiaceae bacterium]|nr:DUF1538 domain-containing protein [Clostridiaceae bacterium]
MILNLFDGFGDVLIEVALALTPIAVVFAFFQIFVLKFPKKKIINIIKGVIITFFGLSFFLQGVNAGFMPVGELMGMALGESEYSWVLVPIGFLLGFAVTLAEPSVHVLVDQVEEASGGHINKKVMLITVCIGVSISVALAMLRVIKGIPLWYILIPGYIIAFVLAKFVPAHFVPIAFDSGSAATGPMTVTLILAIVMGAAKQIEGRDPLIDGFGMTTIVALAPILTVLLLGFLYGRKEKETDG